MASQPFCKIYCFKHQKLWDEIESTAISSICHFQKLKLLPMTIPTKQDRKRKNTTVKWRVLSTLTESGQTVTKKNSKQKTGKGVKNYAPKQRSVKGSHTTRRRIFSQKIAPSSPLSRERRNTRILFRDQRNVQSLFYEYIMSLLNFCGCGYQCMC